MEKAIVEFESKLRSIFPKGCICSRQDNKDPEESTFAEILQRSPHVILFVWHEWADCTKLYDDFELCFKGEAKDVFDTYKQFVHWECLDSGAVIVSSKEWLENIGKR
jgi:hypothetical protein